MQQQQQQEASSCKASTTGNLIVAVRKGFCREPKIMLTAKTHFAASLTKLTSNTRFTAKTVLPRAVL
jgi:hypothetical protein